MNIIEPKLTFQMDQLFDELVPSSGKADSIAGEIIRAAAKLRYDFYNNGMGNNTSGAINLLKKYDVVEDTTYDNIWEYTRGRIYEGNYNLDDTLHKSIEEMTSNAVTFVLNNPGLRQDIYEVTDMFDLEDDYQHFCDECGCDIEDEWLVQEGMCPTCYEYAEAEREYYS